MEWSVVKIGIQQFDILHAYGLGTLLATACNVPVELRDMGYHTILLSSAPKLPRMSCGDLLERVLPLPREEDVRACAPSAPLQSLPVTVLDGLLAALFTSPGLRVFSVSDLLGRLRLDEKAIQQGIRKAAKSISRWKRVAGQDAEGKEEDWLADIVREYDREHPSFPVLSEGKPGRDVNVLIPIDPSFGYSLRRARSDGRMTRRTQVTVRGTRYGALLAFVGAARFLRAQRLGGELVNCYITIAEHLFIAADTSLPLLLPMDERSDQAVLLRWLTLAEQNMQTRRVWSALAYQTLLTQGQQQSLSLESGVMETGWLVPIQEPLGGTVITTWRALLSAKGAHEDQESLRDCLINRSAEAWVDHLRTLALRLLSDTEGWTRRYSLEEVRRITEAMLGAENTPLKRVLEREQGTLCFGRALRQIGRHNPSRLRDLLDELQEVQTLAQVLPVLHRVIVASELEKGKKHPIIVPSEKDMIILLEDVDHYGVPVLAGLLLVLSALRYPRRDDVPTNDAAEEKPRSPEYEIFLDDPASLKELPEEDEER